MRGSFVLAVCEVDREVGAGCGFGTCRSLVLNYQIDIWLRDYAFVKTLQCRAMGHFIVEFNA